MIRVQCLGKHGEEAGHRGWKGLGHKRSLLNTCGSTYLSANIVVQRLEHGILILFELRPEIHLVLTRRGDGGGDVQRTLPCHR